MLETEILKVWSLPEVNPATQEQIFYGIYFLLGFALNWDTTNVFTIIYNGLEYHSGTDFLSHNYTFYIIIE